MQQILLNLFKLHTFYDIGTFIMKHTHKVNLYIRILLIQNIFEKKYLIIKYFLNIGN